MDFNLQHELNVKEVEEFVAEELKLIHGAYLTIYYLIDAIIKHEIIIDTSQVILYQKKKHYSDSVWQENFTQYLFA